MARTDCASPGCRRRAVHQHHIVYVQELRWHRGDPKDERNLMPLCMACHFEHHSREKPLTLAALPDAVFGFATELLGADGAYAYLSRRYGGRDGRLDALLAG